MGCIEGYGGANPDYHPTYVKQNVLEPMGIDTTIFNEIPVQADDRSTALSYADSADTTKGLHWPQIKATAAGGWVSNAEELAKFMIGLRKNTVLDAATADSMFTGQLGWYQRDGLWGQYFDHNGGLHRGEQFLHTGVIRLNAGYDCVMLVNSAYDEPDGDGDPVYLMREAFEGD